MSKNKYIILLLNAVLIVVLMALYLKHSHISDDHSIVYYSIFAYLNTAVIVSSYLFGRLVFSINNIYTRVFFYKLGLVILALIIALAYITYSGRYESIGTVNSALFSLVVFVVIPMLMAHPNKTALKLIARIKKHF
jgi:hypothetical protein